jgi:hypothetical protein
VGRGCGEESCAHEKNLGPSADSFDAIIPSHERNLRLSQ